MNLFISKRPLEDGWIVNEREEDLRTRALSDSQELNGVVAPRSWSLRVH
jgi:hypothetical protein